MNYENMSENAREKFGQVSLEHIGRELITLADYRSRIHFARLLLTRGAPPEDVIAVLDGKDVPPALSTKAG